MTVFIAGVDPGLTTGVAIFNATELVQAWQDDEDVSIRRLITWCQKNKDAEGLIGVEDAFLGKGPHASLTVARSGGRCEGALMIAGYPVARTKRLGASEWRGELGITQLAQVACGGKKSKNLEAAARLYAKKLANREFPVNETHMAEAICMGKVMQARFAATFQSALWRNR